MSHSECERLRAAYLAQLRSDGHRFKSLHDFAEETNLLQKIDQELLDNFPDIKPNELRARDVLKAERLTMDVVRSTLLDPTKIRGPYSCVRNEPQ